MPHVFLTTLAASIGIISFVGLIAAGSAWIFVKARTHGLLAPLLVGAALRVSVMLIAHVATIGPGPDGLFFPDDLGFTRIGSTIADAWVQGEIVDVSNVAYAGTLNYGFQAMVATVFVLVGSSVLAVKLVNVLLGCATIVVVGVLGLRLFGEIGKRRAAWTMALLPTAIWWSSVMLKETAATFLVVVAILMIFSRPSLKTLATYAGAVVAMLLLRPAGAIALVLAAVGTLGYVGVRYRGAIEWQRLRLRILLGVAAALLVGFILSSGNPAAPLEQLEATARSMFDLYQDGSLASIPVDVPRSTFAPYPWVFTETTDNWDRALYPGMWFWYALLPTAALGAWRLRRSPEMLGLAIPIATTLVIYAVTSGIAFRQRSMIEPLVILLFVAGVDSWRETVRRGAIAFFVVAFVAGVQSRSAGVAVVVLIASLLLFLASRRLPSMPAQVPLPSGLILDNLKHMGAPHPRALRPVLQQLRSAAPALRPIDLTGSAAARLARILHRTPPGPRP